MTQAQDGPFGIATIEVDGSLTPAVVWDEKVLILDHLLVDGAPGSVREMLLGDWDGWCDRIAAALGQDRQAAGQAAADTDFAPPLPDPANIYLAGANYYDHVEEMNVAAPDKAVDDPFHFMVTSASLVGSGHDVLRPQGAVQFDWEVELAVVIGHRAERLPVADALTCVAGYAVANDLSIRGPQTFHPFFGLRFLYAKGQATLTPMGPMIVPARFVADPGTLAVSTHVNGEVRQKSNTRAMIFSVQEQISYLSGRAPLLPGDVILTGTPAGTAAAYDAYLEDGDVVSCRIEGLGTLENRVVGTGT